MNATTWRSRIDEAQPAGPAGWGPAVRWPAMLWLVLAAVLAAGGVRAQEIDPPARVGAVTALRGEVDVSFEPGGAWDPARLNQPVTTGTALFAQPGSQAELRIGSASVRLDGNTQAVFSRLDDQGIAIDVPQGTVRARVRSLPPGDSFSLVADGVRAEVREPGDYRVAYDPDRRAYTVMAFAGRLNVVTPTNSFNLESNQQALVEQGGSSMQLRALGPRDEFDRWAEARDREQDRPVAARYVSPETTGIDALDGNGRWEVSGDDGPVWYPTTVAAGWAPYRYGHWAFVRPWGWTWIDDAPWGYAPFHYGRWALFGNRWGWCPGPVVARPVWAPALVGYVGGGGGNVSINIGIGAGAPVGWFPLAPRELYRPPYRSSVTYVNQVNVTVIHGDRDRRGDRRWPEPGSYRYAQRPDALTVVDADTFRNGRAIARERLPVTPQLTQQLRPVTNALPVAPPVVRDRANREIGPGALPRDGRVRVPERELAGHGEPPLRPLDARRADLAGEPVQPQNRSTGHPFEAQMPAPQSPLPLAQVPQTQTPLPRGGDGARRFDERGTPSRPEMPPAFGTPPPAGVPRPAPSVAAPVAAPARPLQQPPDERFDPRGREGRDGRDGRDWRGNRPVQAQPAPQAPQMAVPAQPPRPQVQVQPQALPPPQVQPPPQPRPQPAVQQPSPLRPTPEPTMLPGRMPPPPPQARPAPVQMAPQPAPSPPQAARLPPGERRGDDGPGRGNGRDR